MKKDPLVFISHRVECIEIIERYVRNTKKSSFMKSVQKQDAVIRRIEIIGEATKHFPKEIKDKYSIIPWQKIAGMRDMLIHEYFGVDLELTWNVATKDIPRLKKEIKKIKLELMQ
ncbi:hypothetical protein AMJ83_06090 [candidate division WOR_3 bacterium SM23_42]|uniref:DUF86 domain-containing protein n=1 Tax=candidate division WOR_3 bacterium SM23_42 TaxID=1703779 RepID=A0A0S8FSA6_UNCW3|nr:MAG: hypothetical protein AMJ83_06090 [candidate division WOR_3 bacterium SM23_42]